MSSLLPIGPHDERLGRLDVSGKHELSKSIDINEKVSDYLNVARENLATSSSYQHQTLKEIAKQNEQLKLFNDKIIRQYEEIQRQKYFSSGTKFPISKEPLLGSYVVDPEQVSPALKACEDRIKAMEEEMSLRERDMVKMAGMVDLLVDENKYLRDHIASKNKDLTKVLETIGLNDGEAIHDLRHRLTLLGDENNILLQHLEDLKIERDQAEINSRENQLLYQREKENFEATKKKLEEALVREEILTNNKQQLEPKHRLVMEKLKETEAELQDTVDELDRAKNQLTLVTNQAQQYRKNLEELDSKKTLEVDKMVQEVSFLQNEKKELKKLLNEKDKQLEVKENDIKKLRREIESIKVELEDVTQNKAHVKVELENVEQTLEVSQKRERELRNKNEDLQEEYERVKNKLRNIEDYYKKEIETLINDHNTKLNRAEQALEHTKAKKLELIREKDNEILSLTDQVQDMKKALHKLRSERDEGLQRIEELSNTDEEMRKRERQIYELQGKVEELESQLTSAQRDLTRPIDTQTSPQQRQRELSPSETRNSLQGTLPDENGQTIKRSQVFNDQSTRIKQLEEENARLKSRGSIANVATGDRSKRELDLERENAYLHNMLKNLAKDESLHRPTYTSVEAPPRHVYVSQPSPYLSSVSQSVSQSATNNRSQFQGAPITTTIDYKAPGITTIESPKKSLKEIDELINRIKFNGSRYEDNRASTIVSNEAVPKGYASPEYRSTVNAESGLASHTTSQPQSQERGSKADRLINDILRKYQMDKLPEATEAQLKKSEQIIETISVEKAPSQNLRVSQIVAEGSKSPAVNFLSPLLSSAELGSKNNTLLYSNFLAREDVRTTDFVVLNKTAETEGLGNSENPERDLHKRDL